MFRPFYDLNEQLELKLQVICYNLLSSYSIFHLVLHDFYRAMHYSAKRGIAIACRLSVCNVGDLGPHRLEISETNCTDN